jgi:hypothetical protein
MLPDEMENALFADIILSDITFLSNILEFGFKP